MNRKKLLNKAFQRGHLLTLKNPIYRQWIKKFIVDEIKGDIGKGDITSNSILRNNSKVKAIIKSKEKGILAGVEETKFLLKNYNIKTNKNKKDGSLIKKNSVIMEIEGKLKDVLKTERSALDLLQRMSGIATLTFNLIKKTKNKVGIAPTRKTQWRYLDKKATFLGKGLTHRLALWESTLIKDNHLVAIRKEGIKNNIKESIKRAWSKRKIGEFIEIEVKNQKEALEAAKTFKELKSKQNNIPCFIMLDNIKPNEIKKIIKEIKKRKYYNDVLIESSGGINPKNIINYAKTGVDVLSLGYLTHSPRSLDMALIIK